MERMERKRTSLFSEKYLKKIFVRCLNYFLIGLKCTAHGILCYADVDVYLYTYDMLHVLYVMHPKLIILCELCEKLIMHL